MKLSDFRPLFLLMRRLSCLMPLFHQFPGTEIAYIGPVLSQAHFAPNPILLALDNTNSKNTLLLFPTFNYIRGPFQTWNAGCK